jgi:phospholipid/cholesterol/gamma-HCH transport system substrate-binding protein
MINRKQGLVETIFGGIVFVTACVFLVYAVKISSLNNEMTGTKFKLYANFESVDGLRLGSDVLLAGVKVGTVDNIELDTQDFVAKATFSLFDDYNIPDDTEAIIISGGLLGEKYVSLNVGGSDTSLVNGDEFIYTQSSVNIFNLLGKFVNK